MFNGMHEGLGIVIPCIGELKLVILFVFCSPLTVEKYYFVPFAMIGVQPLIQFSTRLLVLD